MLKKFTAALTTIATVGVGHSYAGTITEYYYQPVSPNLNDIIVNNWDNAPYVPLGLNLLANSIVNDDSELAPLDPDLWSGAQWTGLNPADRSSNSQRALKLKSQSSPNYGNTLFQRDGNSVGMHLNTFGLNTLPMNPAEPQVMTSLQYRMDLNKKLWDKNDLLCMSGVANIASSYSAGSVNQIMMTMHFQNTRYSGQGFHLNVYMFDSRPGYNLNDNVLFDTDPDSVHQAIIVSKLQSQGQNNSKYTMPVPGYGNPLAAVETGTAISGDRDRGFCISKSQFQTMLNDVITARKNGSTPYGHYSNNISEYKISYGLIGPEMNISGGRGHVGMNVSSMWIYRMK